MRTRRKCIAPLLALLVVASCSDDESVERVVDPATGPTDRVPTTLDLRLLTPVRAASVTEGGTGPWPMILRGEVCDPDLGIAELRINGEPVGFDPTAECSQFEVQTVSRWGLNLIEAEVEDLDGNQVFRAQSYLRGPDWLGGPDAPAGEAAVPRAILLHLRQELLDDGDRDPPANDLATVVEMTLADVNLAENMDPVLFDDIHETTYNCLGWTEHNHDGDRVSLTGPLTYSRVTIDQIRVADGHLSVIANMYDLHMPIKVFHYGDQGCLGDWERTYYGVADVDRLEISTHLVVSASPEGDLVLTAEETETTPHGFSYEMDRFLDFMEGRVSDGIESGLEDSGPAFQTLINAQLASTLGMFEVPERIELPEPAGLTLLLDAGWDGVRVVPRVGGPGFLQLTAKVAVRPEAAAAAHAAAPGSIEAGGDVPDLDSSPPLFAMALKEDLLNQMLWATWVGGAFDCDDIGAASGVSQLTGLKISTMAHLPPVIMPGRQPGQVLLGVGDLHGEMPLTRQLMDAAVQARPDLAARGACAVADPTAELWLSMLQEGELSIDAQTGKFVFTPTAAAEVIVEVAGVEDARCAAVLGGYLRQTLTTLLPSFLHAAIAEFPAPHFETDAIPGGVSWDLEQFQLNRMDRYHCVEGTLRSSTPAGGR